MNKRTLSVVIASTVVLVVTGAWTGPLTTALTYQGQLEDGGLPADGDFDMAFTLYDGELGGGLVAGPLVFDGGGGNADAINVINGLFHAELDSGNVFQGSALWLQVHVRPHGGGKRVDVAMVSFDPERRCASTRVRAGRRSYPGSVAHRPR